MQSFHNASADADADSPIRVVVTPSQSSYFAGETFSVTITFTNTSPSPVTYTNSFPSPAPTLTPTQTPTPGHTPWHTPSQTPRTASSFKHKRASHSISSAPLARPPTSPGMPSRSVVVPESGAVVGERSSWWGRGLNSGVDSEVATRKGLLGKHGKDKDDTKTMSTSKSDHLPDLIEQRRKRLLAKSLSVSISPRELEQQLPEGTLARSTPNSISTSSPSFASFSDIDSQPASETNSSLYHTFGFGLSTDSESIPASPSTTTVTDSSTVFESTLDNNSTAPSSPGASFASLTSHFGGPVNEDLNTDVKNGTVPHESTCQFAQKDPPNLSQRVIGLGPPPKGFRSAFGIGSSSSSTETSSSRSTSTTSTTSTSTNGRTTTMQQHNHSHHHHLHRPRDTLLDVVAQPSPPLHSAPPQQSHHRLPPSSRSHPTISADHSIDPPLPSPYVHPRTASASSFPIAPAFPIPSFHSHPNFTNYPLPRSELILYSYAQLSGQMVLLPPSSNGDQQQQLRAMRMLRSKLAKKTVIGGGSMDLTPSLAKVGSGAGLGVSDGFTTPELDAPPSGKKGHRPPKLRVRPTHGRSTSLAQRAGGLISSLLSPTTGSAPSFPFSPTSPYSPVPDSALSSSSSAPWSQASLQSPTGNGGPRSFSVGDAGTGVETVPEHEVDIDPDIPLPMFESQPSMLAIDLSLASGESKSYTYSITIPSVLPPTYKGRCIKFSYELSIGVCRAGSGVSVATSGNGTFVGSPPPSLASGNGVSRVMKVPIRVYGYVAVGRVPRPYDLLWPVGRRIWDTQQGLERGAVVESEADDKSQLKSATAAKDRGEDEEHGKGTLEEFTEYARRMVAATTTGRLREIADEDEHKDDDVKIGCREAVEIVTRNPKKVSYDVSKDGVNVAVLTFTKSAYRLGETVLGVVEFNSRKGRARVLQMSAVLEAHESLPSSLSSTPVKRVHAEQHQSFVMSILRTTFSLDIPSDAAPAFQVEAGDSDDVRGGLEWKVRLSLLVVIAKENGGGLKGLTEGVMLKGMVRDGPRGVWGSAWSASESIAPMEKVPPEDATPEIRTRGWAWYLASAILGPPTSEDDSEESYDGIKPDMGGGVGCGVNYGGGESGWRAGSIELVECSVPVRVWAGNTAFKPVSVVFDL